MEDGMDIFINTIKRNRVMRQFVILLITALGMAVTAQAQTYLEHLKKQVPGLGTVTVNQSKDIDELVNGKKPAATLQDNKTNNNPTAQKNNEQPKKATEQPKKTAEQSKKTAEQPQHKAKADSLKKTETEKEETETPDLRKKVMRRSYKVTGYRVQAYAGGNSREDRQKAEQIGNSIKMRYPDQPVYVHFYSPRWICRVGNFRSQAEATQMLQKIRDMGYKQACLVKGQITVQN